MRLPIYEIIIDGKPRKIELTRKGENEFTGEIDEKTLNIKLPALNLELGNEFKIKIDDKTYKVEIPEMDSEEPYSIRVDGVTFKVEAKIVTRGFAPAIFKPVSVATAKRTIEPKQAVEGAVNAPMTGVILSVSVKKGDHVKKGQVMCILEAMKMANEIRAYKAGTVKMVYVSEGSSVSEGEALLVIE